MDRAARRPKASAPEAQRRETDRTSHNKPSGFKVWNVLTVSADIALWSLYAKCCTLQMKSCQQRSSEHNKRTPYILRTRFAPFIAKQNTSPAFVLPPQTLCVKHFTYLLHPFCSQFPFLFSNCLTIIHRLDRKLECWNFKKIIIKKMR